MNILFIHQNFPGQYRHVLHALQRLGHHCMGLGIQKLEESIPDGIIYRRYSLARGNTTGIHPLVLETESKMIRGEACASAAFELRQKGFFPDLICAHPGWGEALFLQHIWPGTPILCYQEFFYQEEGFDLGFDPELQGERSWKENARTAMKNAHLLLTLESSSWNVCPTLFQRSSFPSHWQSRISVIHDGIDSHKACPNPNVADLTLPDSTVLQQGDPVVTFVNRRMEPYRGFHTFVRALPLLQKLVPTARVVLVGGTSGVSYGAQCSQGEWKDQFLAEIEGAYNPEHVHFTGPLPYASFLNLLQLSACHVYLTYPFVLSWSLLEAMSCGCAVVGSATAPVEEVIRNGHNGLLVNFFSPGDLATAIAELLSHPDRAAQLGQAARETILSKYTLEQCVPRHLALLDLVASKSLGLKS